MINIHQDHISRWIVNAGDRNNVKQQIKSFLWVHTPSFSINWRDSVFCSWLILCCLLCFFYGCYARWKVWRPCLTLLLKSTVLGLFSTLLINRFPATSSHFHKNVLYICSSTINFHVGQTDDIVYRRNLILNYFNRG